MDKHNLIDITEQYCVAKDKAEALQRVYDTIKVTTYLSEGVQGFGNQAGRDAALVQLMEINHRELIDQLYEARGISRRLFLLREAIIETQKQDRFINK